MSLVPNLQQRAYQSLGEKGMAGFTPDSSSRALALSQAESANRHCIKEVSVWIREYFQIKVRYLTIASNRN